jgi:ABC-type lipoprotein release transport system permease subunit
MGANKQMIRRIFLFEGWLISSLGACIGLVVGVLVCLSQEYFGWLKLGNGSEFIISAYPIDLQAFDLLSIALIVLTIGWIAAWYPTHKMNIK